MTCRRQRSAGRLASAGAPGQSTTPAACRATSPTPPLPQPRPERRPPTPHLARRLAILRRAPLDVVRVAAGRARHAALALTDRKRQGLPRIALLPGGGRALQRLAVDLCAGRLDVDLQGRSGGWEVEQLSRSGTWPVAWLWRPVCSCGASHAWASRRGRQPCQKRCHTDLGRGRVLQVLGQVALRAARGGGVGGRVAGGRPRRRRPVPLQPLRARRGLLVQAGGVGVFLLKEDGLGGLVRQVLVRPEAQRRHHAEDGACGRRVGAAGGARRAVR